MVPGEDIDFFFPFLMFTQICKEHCGHQTQSGRTRCDSSWASGWDISAHIGIIWTQEGSSPPSTPGHSPDQLALGQGWGLWTDCLWKTLISGRKEKSARLPRLGTPHFTLFTYHCFCFFKKINEFGCAGFQLWHAGSSSLTRDQTRAPYFGGMKFQPLDRQRSPSTASSCN